MRRTLLIAAFVLLALVVAGALIVNRLLDPEVARAALERQASAALGHPVKMAAVEWAVLGRPRLVLSGIQIGEPPAITLDRVELTTGLRALLSKRVEDAGIVVTGSQLTLPLPLAFAGDTPGPGASADAAGASSALTIASIDRIAFEDVELVSQGRRLRLDVESSLEGDRLQISTLRLQSDGTKVSGRGELSSVRERRGAFSLTADPLDLDELLAIMSGLSGPRPAATKSAPASESAATHGAAAARRSPADPGATRPARRHRLRVARHDPGRSPAAASRWSRFEWAPSTEPLPGVCISTPRAPRHEPRSPRSSAAWTRPSWQPSRARRGC